MKTKTEKKTNITPFNYPIDGSAVNLPIEENIPEDMTIKSNEELPDLDEDIMMYMINI